MTRSLARVLVFVVAPVSLGCSGDDGSEDGVASETSDGSTAGPDSSQAGIEAMLTDGSYHEWLGDPAVRSSDNDVNPHGDGLRVFFNELAVAAGNDGSPAPGSVVIKEFYDQGGAMVGSAVRIKDEAGDWVYYCTNPGGTLCAAEGEPVYGVDTQVACGYCHGDLWFAPLPQ